MSIKKWYKTVEDWFDSKYTLQTIGTALLIASLVLLFFKEIGICYITLGIVLIIDLILVGKHEKTITQWFRPKLPRLVDTILTIGIVVAFILLHGPIVGLYFLSGTINGHLNGDF